MGYIWGAKMTNSKRLDNILKLMKTASKDKVNLFIITRTPPKKGEKYEVFQTKITPELGETFLENAKNQLELILKNESFEYCDFDPVTKHLNCVVETIENNNVPNLDIILGKMKNLELDTYNKDTPYVISYAVKLDDIGVTLFQYCPPKKILTPTKIIKIIEKDGSFSEISGDILTVDPEIIDCIHSETEDELYIVNKYPFERIFGFVEAIKVEVSDKLDVMDDSDLIINVDDLLGVCVRDNRKMKRLYNVLNNGGLELLKPDNLTIINKRHKIDLKLNSNGKIELDGKNAWKVIHILNDDYLVSVLTDNPFLSLNKKNP